MADTQSIHPHLSGVLAPVRSEDDFELKVVGRIPDALAGAYYRNGPNPQFDPQGPYLAIPRRRHDPRLLPRAEQRWRPRALSQPLGSHPEMAGGEQGGTRCSSDGFGSAAILPPPTSIRPGEHPHRPPCRQADGAAVSTANRSSSIRIGLERGGFMNTGGKRTAHPKIDPETGEMVWFAYFAGSAAVQQPDRLWRHRQNRKRDPPRPFRRTLRVDDPRLHGDAELRDVPGPAAHRRSQRADERRAAAGLGTRQRRLSSA